MIIIFRFIIIICITLLWWTIVNEIVSGPVILRQLARYTWTGTRIERFEQIQKIYECKKINFLLPKGPVYPGLVKENVLIINYYSIITSMIIVFTVSTVYLGPHYNGDYILKTFFWLLRETEEMKVKEVVNY